MNRQIYRKYVIVLKGDNMRNAFENLFKKKKKPFSFTSIIDRLKPKKAKKKNKPTTFRLLEVCVLVVTTAIISLTIGSSVTALLLTNIDNNQNSDLSKPMQGFIKNYNYIKDNFYGDFNETKVLDSAIKGVLDSLGDPYSSFLNDAESLNFEITLKGTYQGIGIEIVNTPDNKITIHDIFPDSPAESAGLKINDAILSVNGIDMVGKPTSDLSSYIRNAKANDFIIKYARAGVEKTITITKRVIIIQSVHSKTFTVNNKKVGYIQVDIFSATTYNQFKVALDALEKENIDSLIIDLRGNSGGHLNVVQDMTSLFLNSKHVIYQTEDKNGIDKFYSTGRVDKKYPIVFLADGQSASASELMIGALKDELNAIVIGEKTYGKGTVQELQTLANGASYKFTTKKWLTPKGVWIHGKGISPNIEVKLDSDYLANPSEATDNQLQTAIQHLTK